MNSVLTLKQILVVIVMLRPQKAHSLFQCLSQDGICLHAVQCNYICLHHVTLIYKFSVGGP